ncbi:MAG: glycosyltransferase family 2 protein [Patescibacteria group bacterium]|jgi:glycosyltransferase involved in cell wall biosynthesis
MKISFVIPSFNEAESLPELLRQIDSVGHAHAWNYEIIIIDDGSTDNTFTLLSQQKNIYPRLHVIRFRRNQGKAACLSVGFLKATGDRVITLDADLQDDPQDIPRLLKKIEEGFDAVTGWKFERHDPWHKVLPSHVINGIVRAMFGLRIHDMNCGLKAFRKEVLGQLPIYGDLYRYILIFAHSRGFKVTEIPTTHHSRKFGVSKYGFSRFAKGFFDLFTVFFLIKYSKKPLHFFGGLGLALSSFGGLILVYLAIVHFTGQSIGDRPLLLLGILLFLTGLQFVMTGFIAELLTSHTKNQEPPIDKEI